MNKREIAY